jgi:drug/metabolite transporter (DMT)-like permease
MVQYGMNSNGNNIAGDANSSQAAPRSQRVGVALMLLAMFLIVCNDAVGKHLTQQYSVWQLLWMRSWVWMALVLAWVSQSGGLRVALKSKRPLLQTIRALVLVVEVVVFVFAFRSLPLADVTAIGAATPLVVLALAVVFLGERVGPYRWVAVAVGLLGTLLVARPGFGVFGWATLLPIAGMLLWGIYQVLVRIVSREDPANTTLLYGGLAIFIVSGSCAPWVWMWPATATDWGLFLLVGLLNTGGHFALVFALQRASPSVLQPFSYSIVVWAALVGWLVFDTLPDQMSTLGAGLVVAAGLYAWYRERIR